MVTRLFKKIVELTKMTTSTTLLCIKKILESVIIKVFGCLKKKRQQVSCYSDESLSRREKGQNLILSQKKTIPSSHWILVVLRKLLRTWHFAMPSTRCCSSPPRVLVVCFAHHICWFPCSCGSDALPCLSQTFWFVRNLLTHSLWNCNNFSTFNLCGIVYSICKHRNRWLLFI